MLYEKAFRNSDSHPAGTKTYLQDEYPQVMSTASTSFCAQAG